MKRLSIGVIIFGIIFVLTGLQCLKGLSVYFTFHEISPLVYKSAMTRVIQTKTLIEEKKGLSSEERDRAQAQLSHIKEVLQQYRARYIQGKGVPLPLLFFMVASFLVSGVFLFTGISILQLRPSTRKWISRSFLAGLVLSLLFFWSALSEVLFIARLTDRFASIFARISTDSTYQQYIFSSLRDTLLAYPSSYVILMGYALYLAFMSCTSIFFARPKIKELYSEWKV